MDQTKDCTRELIAKAHNNDKEAREKLVTDNLGLIWNIIKRFKGRGTEQEDLFQIGCIGLIKAMAEIYDCCVIGVGEEGQTKLKLFVVKNKKFKNDDEEMLKKKIIEFGMQNLSKWSVPKIIEFIDALPRTKIGKVDFKVLK